MNAFWEAWEATPRTSCVFPDPLIDPFFPALPPFFLYGGVGQQGGSSGGLPWDSIYHQNNGGFFIGDFGRNTWGGWSTRLEVHTATIVYPLGLSSSELGPKTIPL